VARIGLGDQTAVDVRVRTPGADPRVLHGVEVDRQVTLLEPAPATDAPDATC
jgi:hypothetical protein